MQVWPRHASRRANETNLLSTLDGVPNGNRRLREVKVARDDSAAVIDVHDVARQEEIVDECHDTTIRRAHRIARLAREIDAAMAAR
jgi:hypothetical protein